MDRGKSSVCQGQSKQKVHQTASYLSELLRALIHLEKKIKDSVTKFKFSCDDGVIDGAPVLIVTSGSSYFCSCLHLITQENCVKIN